MLLSDVKDRIVDLNRSEWDEKKSDPKNCKYVFTKKVYLKNSDYNDSAIRPQHVLKFVSYDSKDDYAGFIDYQRNYDAEAVNVDDPYYPEMLNPNSEGHFVFKDTILVKIPLKVWLEKRDQDRKRYDAGHKLTDSQFNAETRAGGAEYKGDI